MDHAATTPVDARVLRAMTPYFTEEFGNPSNLYAVGLRAKEAIAEAVRKIAGVLNCAPDEFIFTGSATEADNLALRGLMRTVRGLTQNSFRDGQRQVSVVPRPRIIISAVEHKAVLETARDLEKDGVEVIYLPVDRYGVVDPEELKSALNERTVLVSVMYANNEIGVVQPIAEIGELIKKFRGTTALPIFHTDAVQAIQYLDCNVERLGVDLMTLSAHKLYGPKGIGGLYVRRGVNIRPIIFGGGQQRGLRAGTENVPAIVGFGEAVKLASSVKSQESRRIKKLRDKLEKGIFKTIPKVVLNGYPTKRLPNFLNVSVLDIEGEAALLYLDEKGISVNTGSACNSQSLEPSYVLTALGRPYEYIHGSIRFTLGRGTTASDINYVLRVLPPIVKKLRRISPLNLKPGAKAKISEPKAFIGGQTPHFLKKK